GRRGPGDRHAQRREDRRRAARRRRPRRAERRDGRAGADGEHADGEHRGRRLMTTDTKIPDIVIITGMSGAGRSTAAKSLEDLDWFVVDNLPPGLLATMADLGGRVKDAVPRIAVVVDVRSRAFTEDLHDSIAELEARGVHPRVVFLEASDEDLVRRFESVRRPHPLQDDGRLVDGIARERELVREVRAEADLVIDTSGLNVHELRNKIIGVFGNDTGESSRRAPVVSFGYKYGLPVDADRVVDCRFLPNPHWVPELRPKTGRDPAVRDYVLGQRGAKEFLDAYSEVLRLLSA